MALVIIDCLNEEAWVMNEEAWVKYSFLFLASFFA